jgi:hypothetical protein
MPELQLSRDVNDARSKGARYEGTLEPMRRKALGQFFTGIPLSRLLAAVALDRTATTAIDPMAGHGDLLDAVVERAVRNDWRMKRLQGIEIDPATAAVCAERLQIWNDLVDDLVITAGDAFLPTSEETYLAGGYDLVITNPPYVRYQRLAAKNSDIPQLSPEEIRSQLAKIVSSRVLPEEFSHWRRVIDEYSGLSDLSVPAWILCAALIRPGGVLALVAPTAWRSRNYGHTLEHLLATCFRPQYLIEDTQPGWFSDALVRTQLVVARRLTATEARIPVTKRTTADARFVSVKVSPSASANGSLVGSAFPTTDPEGAFDEWIRATARGTDNKAPGIVAQSVRLADFMQSRNSGGRSTSARNKEAHNLSCSLFTTTAHSAFNLVPRAIQPLTENLAHIALTLPESAEVSVTQGLRTGCNGFFYVDEVGASGDVVQIRLSAFFDQEVLTVPVACLMPVLRRQAEVNGPIDATQVSGRALNLSGWILPEDGDVVQAARSLYEREGVPLPKVMPADLAAFVRRAGETTYTSGDEQKRISELSAVKTNVRQPGNGRIPRFWYMLPPFAKRHRPDAFVPRINQFIPWIEMNGDPPMLIDANFSTIWSSSSQWTRFGFRALFNTQWCRACMETLGTPFGGGALKLEATQLRRVPIPLLSTKDLAFLDSEGRAMACTSESVSATVDRFVAGKIMGTGESDARVDVLLRGLKSIADSLCQGRQRKAV